VCRRERLLLRLGLEIGIAAANNMLKWEVPGVLDLRVLLRLELHLRVCVFEGKTRTEWAMEDSAGHSLTTLKCLISGAFHPSLLSASAVLNAVSSLRKRKIEGSGISSLENVGFHRRTGYSSGSPAFAIF
jgi:hypothetical protein